MTCVSWPDSDDLFLLLPGGKARIIFINAIRLQAGEQRNRD
jgi:hypothetical protein